MGNQHRLAGSNISKVKLHNLRTVLSMLRQQGYASRAHLAEQTGLSTTTISNLVSELLGQGIVTEEGVIRSGLRQGAGRPRTSLRLVPEARHAVGIHIGVGQIRVAVANLRAHLVNCLSLDHPLDRSSTEVLRHVVALVDEALSQSGIDRERVVGVGVGASGLVNPHTGVNLMAPNLGWRDVPIGALLGQQLALPVCVDNNARTMALGEALFGVGKGTHALAFVYARIGVGAGFVVGERLYRGSAAGAGEIGHTTIVPEGGEPCRCGNSGCLETLVSEPAIVRLAEALAAQDPDGILAVHLRRERGAAIERIFGAARAGDVVTQAMLEERACYMGIALANLVNVLNPDLIVLGGIFAQGKDLLLPTVEKVMRQRAFANLGAQVQIRITDFGPQAGAIGAAALALNTFFYQQPDQVPEAMA
ncbi:MAG: ROK family transcriptional regulator [Anaerolineae bacterium]|jgi:glucokinase-like ROK family protein